MTGVLVGPLPVIRFMDGTTQAYEPPRNTMHIRYATCRDHHPACDCREAEWAEHISEWSSEARHLGKVMNEVLAGHLTRELPGEVPCMCTGCQIARRTHHRVLESFAVRRAARDEARAHDGIRIARRNPEEVPF